MSNLGLPKSPNLPIAPVSYARQHFDLLNNVFRLYFNRIDGLFQSLLGALGGTYLEFSHISALGAVDQYASADNTPTLVLFDTLESAAGFTLNISGTATASQNGVYKIDFSLQYANTDNAQHDVFVWLKINGVNLSSSSSRFTIPARKSVGVYGHTIAYSSITFEINASDEVALYWATEKAYNTVGPVNGVFMEHIDAITSPYIRPSNPAAAGSIVFVSHTAT
jgi:hypothetical protein